MANEAMMDISNKKEIFCKIPSVVNLTVKVAGKACYINVLSDWRDQGQLAIELTCESEPDAKADRVAFKDISYDGPCKFDHRNLRPISKIVASMLACLLTKSMRGAFLFSVGLGVWCQSLSLSWSDLARSL